MADAIIRKMELTDIDHVLDVEAVSFQTTWTKDIFFQELVENDFANYFVMELRKKIIGYVGLWVVMGDAQITNIAIRPEYRGKKYGEKLFLYAIKQAIRLNGQRLSLEVRVSNIIAQRMYRKFGLMPGGIRKNYYTDNQEDAIVMWVKL